MQATSPQGGTWHVTQKWSHFHPKMSMNWMLFRAESCKHLCPSLKRLCPVYTVCMSSARGKTSAPHPSCALNNVVGVSEARSPQCFRRICKISPPGKPKEWMGGASKALLQWISFTKLDSFFTLWSNTVIVSESWAEPKIADSDLFMRESRNSSRCSPWKGRTNYEKEGEERVMRFLSAPFPSPLPSGRRPNGLRGRSLNDRTILFLVILLDKTVSVG